MEFTYEAYEKLIENIIHKGYQITNYHSYKKVKCPCILRHDVDMDLKKAADFAEFESKMNLKKGVKATYFVLLTSDFYNLYSKENIQLLKQILLYGHEIGLHFDEKKYILEDGFDANTIKSSVEKEVDILSEMLEAPISTVSMHRPSQEFLDSNFEFKRIINSYNTTFFRDFKYLSDSRMCWRENVESIVESKMEKALHILTHPFWYGKKQKNTKEILQAFIDSASFQRYHLMADNFRNLGEFIDIEQYSKMG